MLERLPIVTAMLLSIASAPIGAVLFAARQRPATEWRGGLMLRGTLHGDRFAIVQDWPERRSRVDVVFEGELPNTVCEGVGVAIEGWLVDDRFEATKVVADRSKYDACWQWQCFPVDDRPAKCRPPRFE